jgi:hypothetical protein
MPTHPHHRSLQRSPGPRRNAVLGESRSSASRPSYPVAYPPAMRQPVSFWPAIVVVILSLSVVFGASVWVLSKPRSLAAQQPVTLVAQPAGAENVVALTHREPSPVPSMSVETVAAKIAPAAPEPAAPDQALPSPIPEKAVPPQAVAPSPLAPSPVAASDSAPPVTHTYGTSVAFLSSPAEAALRAQRERKLLFVLHVAGNFEESCFT